jgi:hypothetical protein
VAAIVGRHFSLLVVAAALGRSDIGLLDVADEAIGYGLVDRTGDDIGSYRFVHALTRDAVESSLDSARHIALHRAVAVAIEATYARDLTEHLADLARHWAHVAPFGAAATARAWAVRAGDEAVRRLAYEEGVRLYRIAQQLPVTEVTDAERCELALKLARAAYFSGDLAATVAAARAAADDARAAADARLLAESALTVEAAPDATVNATARDLADEALAALNRDRVDDPALRARLHALQSHLAFYAGDRAATDSRSRASLDLARESGDDRALVEALRARQEALPGPAGRAERDQLAEEMAATAQRIGSPRAECGAGYGGWRCCPKAASSRPPTGSSRTSVAWSGGLVGRSLGGCTIARRPVSRKPSVGTRKPTNCRGTRLRRCACVSRRRRTARSWRCRPRLAVTAGLSTMSSRSRAGNGVHLSASA